MRFKGGEEGSGGEGTEGGEAVECVGGALKVKWEGDQGGDGEEGGGKGRRTGRWG